MRIMKSACLAVIIVGSVAAVGPSQKTALSAQHKTWLEDDVASIITPLEREVFKKLETDADREALIEEFWRHRDPTPGTARNEFKDEHYRRLEFADKTFSRGVPFQGRKTERGRIYIALGPPIDVQRFMSSEAVPMEIWTLGGRAGLGQRSLVKILFYQRGGGDYVIYNPAVNSPKDLVLSPRRAEVKATDPADWDEWDAGAILVLRDRMLLDILGMTLGSERGALRQQAAIMLAEVQATPQRSVKDDYALAILDHKPVVEVSYSVKLIGNRTAVAVLEGSGGASFLHFVLVPETISIERFGDRSRADLRTTLRLSDASGRTAFQREKSVSIDLRLEELKRLSESSFQLYDAVPVLPGQWTLSLLLENLVTKEFTTVERAIEVPKPGELGLSPIILARQVYRGAAAEGAMRSFQVGRVQVYPSVNNVFPEKSKFHAFLQIRGLTEDLRSQGRMRFTLIGDRAELWRVERALKDYPEPGIALEEVAADKLAAATYTLRASLLDADNREILAAQADVRLTTDPLPGLWVSAQPLPAADDPEIDYTLGMQAYSVGRTEAALEALARASAAEPARAAYALGYAKALLASGGAAKARDVLLPHSEAREAGFDLFETLGRAFYAAGQPREAVTRLKRALSLRGNVVEVLNLLGDCQAELGERAAAAAAWKKSLEIMPNQPRIRALLDK